MHTSGYLESFSEGKGLVIIGSAVIPLLAPQAVLDLKAAAVQQFLLRRWFELGRCGMPQLPKPGVPISNALGV